jgi:hypothetical protein
VLREWESVFLCAHYAFLHSALPHIMHSFQKGIGIMDASR